MADPEAKPARRLRDDLEGVSAAARTETNSGSLLMPVLTLKREVVTIWGRWLGILRSTNRGYALNHTEAHNGSQSIHALSSEGFCFLVIQADVELALGRVCGRSANGISAAQKRS
jgi:hypothetical protein